MREARKKASGKQYRTSKNILQLLILEGPMVTFLFGAMKDAGCPMASNGIECVKCEDNQEGARFDTSSKVKLAVP